MSEFKIVIKITSWFYKITFTIELNNSKSFSNIPIFRFTLVIYWKEQGIKRKEKKGKSRKRCRERNMFPGVSCTRAEKTYRVHGETRHILFKYAAGLRRKIFSLSHKVQIIFVQRKRDLFLGFWNFFETRLFIRTCTVYAEKHKTFTWI